MGQISLMARLNRALTSRRWYRVLLVLNLLVALGCFWAFHDVHNDDQGVYLGQADGLLRTGRYSYWYFLPDYVPDTFRNPGYAFFLVPIRAITDSLLAIKLVQLALCLWAVWLVVQLLRRHGAAAGTDYLAANVFLLLLAANVQFYYFAAQIYPETLGVFLVALYLWGAEGGAGPRGSWRRAVLLGLIAGTLFQIRPIFLLLPLVHLTAEWWLLRGAFRWRPAAVLMVMYGLTLLPYGFWNLRHHGVFKLTPIEGGGGVFQLGFYTHKIPNTWIGRYWSTNTGDELIKFVQPADTAANLRAYNAEWDAIDAELAPLLTAADIARLRYPYQLPTYNSTYTLAREKILVHNTLAHIKAEPVFYLKTRIYTFFRLYFTGIQLSKLRAAPTVAARVAAVFPFIVSFATFLLALVGVAYALLRRPTFLTPATLTALLLTLYCGAIHVPFAIQARYTIPVRLLLLFVTAVAVAEWLPKARQQSAMGRKEADAEHERKRRLAGEALDAPPVIG